MSPRNLNFWSPYAQAGAHGLLTVIVLGSLAIGRPFTESYARETTPKELSGTPQFRAVNCQNSLGWGLALLVGTISLIVAGSVDGRTFLLLIPFGAPAWAYSYTQRVITALRGAAGGGGAVEPAGPPA